MVHTAPRENPKNSAPMLQSIHLENFKGHRDTSVPVGRMTVLVGPNGTGKTSVLQALYLLSSLCEMRSGEVLRRELSPHDLLHRASPGPIVIRLTGQEGNTGWSLLLSQSVPGPGDRSGETPPPALDWSYGEEKGRGERLDLPLRNHGGRVSDIERSFGPGVLYHFDARRIAETSYSTEESPSVAYDGHNLAVVLAALKLEREEVFEQIETEMRGIVPNVERIRIRRVRMSGADSSQGDRVGHKIVFDFKGAPDIPAHGASEGTLVTLALLTALFSPKRPRLLLLDDIDQSLHPEAQLQLVRELKRLLEGFPEVQLIATTHSPYILDELEPTDVHVFALRPDGSIASRRLSEHPQAERMKGALTSGQLWSLDPERRWVLREE